MQSLSVISEVLIATVATVRACVHGVGWVGIGGVGERFRVVACSLTACEMDKLKHTWRCVGLSSFLTSDSDQRRTRPRNRVLLNLRVAREQKRQPPMISQKAHQSALGSELFSLLFLFFGFFFLAPTAANAKIVILPPLC